MGAKTQYVGIISGCLVALVMVATGNLPVSATSKANGRGSRPVTETASQFYFPVVADMTSILSGPRNPTLAPNLVTGATVGTSIVWTAGATDAVPLEYRFSVAMEGQPLAVVRDFESSPSFSWTPIVEGSYQIQMTVQEVPPSQNPAVSLTSTPYKITSRIPLGSTLPIVSPTSHPLVALYSIPPCGTGSVQVEFGTALPSPPFQTTPLLPCSATQSTNVYLVGMKPTTTYIIQATVTTGTTSTPLLPATFTTGAIPSNVAPFPMITAPVPSSGATSSQDAVVFHDAVSSGSAATQTLMYATDLAGSIIWYFSNDGFSTQPLTERPLPGGNVLAELGYTLGPNQLLRVMDPLGKPVQETSVGRIDEQLATFVPAAGHSVDQITELHHDVNLLPNGHTIVFGYIERLLPAGTQGSTSKLPVDVLTDEIIDLDQNLQVDWTWDTFDYLDVNRPAILGETCQPGGGGCPYTLTYGSQSGGSANDWTHSNAVIYSASDHALIVSMRHQDWVLKINYLDGTGDGHILWHLGNGGDFAFTNPPAGETFPWFSHQHGLQITSSDELLAFDNGNTRCTNVPNCHSRGQVYQLNEANKQATLLVQADMGNFSPALGWAQTLSNGDFSFTSGLQTINNVAAGQNEEFDPTGKTVTYVLQDQPEWLYRAYRMPSMYNGCCGD